MLLIEPIELRIDIDRRPLLVVGRHPEQEEQGEDEDGQGGAEIEAVADVVIRRVGGQEGPRGDQATDVAEHDIGADGGGAGGVGDDVGGDVGVAEGAEGEGAAGDEEGGGVADAGVGAGQEHDVASRHQRAADDEEDEAAVELPAEEGEEHGEEAADDVGRHRLQLLRDDAGFGVDGLDDGRGEEGEALDRDVVEEEDEGGR